MPGVIDPETIEVNQLPPVWSPVQGPISDDERIRELDMQATASLLWAATVPEQILRLLLSETDIDPIAEPPADYAPDLQGEWQPGVLTFGFRRPVRVVREQREHDLLVLEFQVDGAGTWMMEIGPERMILERL